MKKNAIRIRKLVFTGLLIVGNVTILSQVALKAEARPCGSGLLDKLGCALDPTNPASNNGGPLDSCEVQECSTTGPVIRSTKTTACYTVGSREGWQKFTFPKTYTRIASISGAWSVDSTNYSNVGPRGYSGSDAQRLEPYSKYKFDQSYPFGALLGTDVSGNARLVESPQDLDQPRRAVYMRINDTAFSDNAGSLQVCFRE